MNKIDIFGIFCMLITPIILMITLVSISSTLKFGPSGPESLSEIISVALATLILAVGSFYASIPLLEKVIISVNKMEKQDNRK